MLIWFLTLTVLKVQFDCSLRFISCLIWSYLFLEIRVNLIRCQNFTLSFTQIFITMKEIIHVCIIDSFELHRIIKFSARFIMFFSGHWWCHLSCYLVKEKSLIMARKLACPVRFPIGTVLQPSELSWGRGRQSIHVAHCTAHFL